MDRRSHDDPWVMRVLAFLIVDDAAKEHAARPHRTASLLRIVSAWYTVSPCPLVPSAAASAESVLRWIHIRWYPL